MVLCLESGFLLGSRADQHQLKKDPEEILVVPKILLETLGCCLCKALQHVAGRSSCLPASKQREVENGIILDWHWLDDEQVKEQQTFQNP